jgi:hypothetical protein
MERADADADPGRRCQTLPWRSGYRRLPGRERGRGTQSTSRSRHPWRARTRREPGAAIRGGGCRFPCRESRQGLGTEDVADTDAGQDRGDCGRGASGLRGLRARIADARWWRAACAEMKCASYLRTRDGSAGAAERRTVVDAYSKNLIE